jgi:hypothetical protein
MDQVVEISTDSGKAVEEQQVTDLSKEMLDKVGGGITGVLL